MVHASHQGNTHFLLKIIFLPDKLVNRSFFSIDFGDSLVLSVISVYFGDFG